jgi:pilus assembly protein TadC
VEAVDGLRLVGEIGKALPGLKNLGRLLTSPDLKEAVDYLFQGCFSAKEFVAGAVSAGLLALSLGIVCLTHVFSLLSAAILSSSLAVFVVLFLLNSVVGRYESEIARIERETPYALEELATIYLSTESLFDAILYVSEGDYGAVSSSLAQMVPLLNAGFTPEHLLTEMASKQPSETLRRGILSIVSFVQTNGTNLDAVIVDSHENLQRRFERLTLQWESRMMVYAGLLVFLPLIIILGLAIRGLCSNPVVLLLPALLFVLSGALRKSLLPHDSILLGE